MWEGGLHFELYLNLNSYSPCLNLVLLLDSADCGGCGTAIELVDCTVCSVADWEGCVAMISLGGCEFCSVGSTNCCHCEVSRNVFDGHICSVIVHCNSLDSRISSSMRSEISVSN